MTFFFGISLLAEEVVIRDSPRDDVLLVAMALIGVPVAQIADRALRTKQSGEH